MKQEYFCLFLKSLKLVVRFVGTQVEEKEDCRKEETLFALAVSYGVRNSHPLLSPCFEVTNVVSE